MSERTVRIGHESRNCKATNAALRCQRLACVISSRTQPPSAHRKKCGTRLGPVDRPGRGEVAARSVLLRRCCGEARGDDAEVRPPPPATGLPGTLRGDGDGDAPRLCARSRGPGGAEWSDESRRCALRCELRRRPASHELERGRPSPLRLRLRCCERLRLRLRLRPRKAVSDNDAPRPRGTCSARRSSPGELLTTARGRPHPAGHRMRCVLPSLSRRGIRRLRVIRV